LSFQEPMPRIKYCGMDSCRIIANIHLLSSSDRTPDVETDKENDPKSNADISDTASPKVGKTRSRVVSSSDEGEQLGESPATPKARRTRSRVVWSSDEEEEPVERDMEQLDNRMESMDDFNGDEMTSRDGGQVNMEYVKHDGSSANSYSSPTMTLPQLHTSTTKPLTTTRPTRLQQPTHMMRIRSQ
jgi:hypothetical protein